MALFVQIYQKNQAVNLEKMNAKHAFL